MSAPYVVSINHAWTGHEETIRRDTFDEALEVYRTKRQSVRGMVTIYGDGYDVDCGPNGFRVCSDGLTDDERERVEAIG